MEGQHYARRVQEAETVALALNVLFCPLRQQTPITLWEHRAARRALSEAGRRSVDEELIFRTIEAQRDLVDSAARQTKAIRRHQARRAHLERRQMIDVTPAPEAPDSLPAPQTKGNALKDHPGFYVEEWYDDD